MKKFLNYMVCCVLVLALTACEDDDVISELVLAGSELQLYEGETGEVEITSGNGKYVIDVAQPTVAEAIVEDGKVVVKALKYGFTTLTISDGAGESASFDLSVLGYFDIELSSHEVEDFQNGRVMTVNIVEGNGEYSIKSADESIATAVVEKDSIIVIKTGNPGETVVTLTDKGGKQDTVHVISTEIVKLIPYKEDVFHIYSVSGRIQLKIEQGNGNYIATSSDESVVSVAEGTQNTIALMLEPKKVGTAILTITDQCGETGVLKVEVHWPVFKTDDPYVYFYGTNAVEKSIYLSGNDEYEVVGDSKPGVVTTSFLYGSLVMKPQGLGRTTLTLKDRSEQTIDVVVTVKDFLTEADVLADDRVRAELPSENVCYVKGEWPTGTFSATEEDGEVSIQWIPDGSMKNRPTQLKFNGGSETGEKEFVSARHSFSTFTKANVTDVKVLKKDGKKIWVSCIVKGKLATWVGELE